MDLGASWIHGTLHNPLTPLLGDLRTRETKSSSIWSPEFNLYSTPETDLLLGRMWDLQNKAASYAISSGKHVSWNTFVEDTVDYWSQDLDPSLIPVQVNI